MVWSRPKRVQHGLGELVRPSWPGRIDMFVSPRLTFAPVGVSLAASSAGARAVAAVLPRRWSSGASGVTEVASQLHRPREQLARQLGVGTVPRLACRLHGRFKLVGQPYLGRLEQLTGRVDRFFEPPSVEVRAG